MITITQYPQQGCSMAALIKTFSRHRFNLVIRWRYAPSGALRIDIDVTGEREVSLQRLLTDFISAHEGFLYEVSPQVIDLTIGDDQQQFVLIPTTDRSIAEAPEIMEETALKVLLAGLKNCKGGAFLVQMEGDAQGIGYAASVICPFDIIPQEISFAFAPNFRLAVSWAIGWFQYDEPRHRTLLTLPYTSASAMVTGFGEPRQAVVSANSEDTVIGPICNDLSGMTLCFTEENWRSSSAIFGAPGYGKTTLILSLLQQAWTKQHISFLVIDPKTDYRHLKHLIPEMNVLNGLQHVNPLLPPRSSDPYSYAEVLINLLSLSTSLPDDSPLPGYIRAVYYQAINDKNLSMKHFLELYDRHMVSQHLVAQAVNFIISGRNRIENLFRTFCGPNFLAVNSQYFDISRLLQTPTVIEIGQLPTVTATSLFMYYVAAHVKLHLQARKLPNIKNCLVFEEAHNVLSPIVNQTVRYELANLLAEGRGRGISCMVIDQSPARIDQSVTNICGNTFSFRLVSQADREYASQMLGVDAERLNALRKQTCITRTNSMYQAETVHVSVAPSLLQSLAPLKKN